MEKEKTNYVVHYDAGDGARKHESYKDHETALSTAELIVSVNKDGLGYVQKVWITKEITVTRVVAEEHFVVPNPKIAEGENNG